MSVQINLLPASKADYVKAQRDRNKLIHLASLVAAFSAALFILLLVYVYGLQRQQLSSANRKLTNAQNALQSTPDLNKMLTIKNQLNTLVTLHQQKHAVNRLFTYLPQLTPGKASISSLSLDFKTKTMTIGGNADSLGTVNQFIDTLKLAQYRSDGSSSPLTAFPSVVESSFSSNGGTASYSLNVKFDAGLFDNRLSNVSLVFANPNSVQSNNSLFRAGQ